MNNTLSCRLGVSPLSWTNEVLENLGGETSALTCLEEAHAAGYQGVEYGRKLPSTSKQLRPLLAQFQLDLVSGWHSGYLAERSVDEEIEAVKPFAHLLREMNCEVLVYGECAMMAPGDALDVPMSGRLKMPEKDIPAYAARLEDFARRLFDQYALKLAYHHHLMMICETLDETRRLMEATSPAVGLLLDTGHAFAAGFDYNDLIELFSDRIVHIHLKDVRAPILDSVRSKDQSFNQAVLSGLFTVPGDGDVDFAPLVNFIHRSGYSGWLVVEAEQDPLLAPPLPTVTRAHKYFTSLLSASPVGEQV